jgi:hypothetical protein
MGEGLGVRVSSAVYGEGERWPVRFRLPKGDYSCLTTLLLPFFCFGLFGSNFFACHSHAQLAADFICQMNGTNNGATVDTNIANQATFKTTFGAGTWTMTPPTGISMWVSNNAAQPLHTPVSVNGFTYPGGDQGWVSDYSVPTNYATYRFNGPGTNKVSLSFTLMLTGLGNSFASINDGYIGGQGDFASVSITDNANTPATPKIGIETGGFQTTANFPITNGIPYDVTIQFDQTSLKAQFSYSDHATGNLLGTTNAALSNVGCDRIFIGRSDAHQLFPSIKACHANLVISYGTGTFPLEPGAGGTAVFCARGISMKGAVSK